MDPHSYDVSRDSWFIFAKGLHITKIWSAPLSEHCGYRVRTDPLSLKIHLFPTVPSCPISWQCLCTVLTHSEQSWPRISSPSCWGWSPLLRHYLWEIWLFIYNIILLIIYNIITKYAVHDPVIVCYKCRTWVLTQQLLSPIIHGRKAILSWCALIVWEWMIQDSATVMLFIPSCLCFPYSLSSSPLLWLQMLQFSDALNKSISGMCVFSQDPLQTSIFTVWKRY